MKRATQILLVFALAACGGNVVVDARSAPSSSSSGSGGSGIGGAGGAPTTTTSFGGGQTIGVTTGFGATSTVGTTDATSGAPPCVPCSALFSEGADPSSLCPGNEVLLFKTMAQCVCQTNCSGPCVDLCQANGPISEGCKSCIQQIPDMGCTGVVQACTNG